MLQSKRGYRCFPKVSFSAGRPIGLTDDESDLVIRCERLERGKSEGARAEETDSHCSASFQITKCTTVPQAFHRGHSIDDETTIQMIIFMLPHTGNVLGRHRFHGLTMLIEPSNPNALRTVHVDQDAGEAQAALLIALLGVLDNFQLGIDPDTSPRQLVRIPRDEQPHGQAHLRSRQTDPLGLVHQLEHPIHNRPDLIIHSLHWLGLEPEDRMGVCENVECRGVH